MLNSLETLWDIFTKKKHSLVMKNVNDAYTKKQVSKVLWWEVLDPKNSDNIPKDNTAINLSINKLLELQGIDIYSLEGKKILDIWAWFTSLPFLLDWINTELNIVDPIFDTNVKNEIIRNKNAIFDKIETFDKKNYEQYKAWNNERQEYLYKLNTEFNNILSGLYKWEKIDFTKKSFSQWNTNINIFPIAGEKINTIDNGSMDLIFINHTITKNQVDPYILLNKAYDLLKISWKIYITESWKLDFSYFELINKEFKVDIIDSYYLNDKTILILEKL